MAEPNDELRQARRRLTSDRHRSGSLSRAELADRVNAFLHAETGRRFEIDANYIGKLERGVIRWPARHYRTALRHVLGAADDRDLGFHVGRSEPASLEGVDRHGFLRLLTGAGMLAATPLMESLSSPVASPVPARIGRADVEQLTAVTAAFVALDNRAGGTLVRESLRTQLRWSMGLLTARCGEDVRRDLFSAVGGLAGIAGFVAFDAYAHDEARRIYRFAVECAEQAGDWHLRANMLSNMARQDIWCGDPDTGLTHVEMALVRSDRLTNTERAMLSTVRARALAKLGPDRTQDALAAVGRADAYFEAADHREDPPEIAYYDLAQHQGDTAHALADLELAGQRTEAVTRLEFAVHNHAAGYARSRALSQITQATLLMSVGDPREGAAVGRRALGVAELGGSRRAVDLLRTLRDRAAPHATIPEVRDLREQLTYVAA
ncbi:hypothetical protein AB0M43_32060 [Longispora sp. NPDC051575]|uniref:hypothetical protein n=1 Tax=Longispora sp. NPDC051575 TaxID=3154943 RepID=UPI003444C112